MMETIFNGQGFYVVVPKKYFSRYVLSYEVLPLSLCAQVSGNWVIDQDELTILLASGMLEENYVVLELERISECSNQYISFSDIKNVLFTSDASLQQFTERSYENFDVTTLNCYVMPASDADYQATNLQLCPPSSIDRANFTREMMFVDGVLAILHRRLEQNQNDSDYLQLVYDRVDSRNQLLTFLLQFEEEKLEETAIGLFFVDLCLDKGIEDGWIPSEILNTFTNESSNEIYQLKPFQIWVDTIKKVINNEDVNLEFTDDGSVVLRSMTLMLLNPEPANLAVIKKTMGAKIGSRVYELAMSFALLRQGYSFLSDNDRKSIGNIRNKLQTINALLHNSAVQFAIDNNQSEIDSINESTPSNLTDIEQHDWLTKLSDSVFSIKKLKSRAAFDLNLNYIYGEALSLKIIDANNKKAMAKFAGKFIKDLIIIQNQLPKESRFEVSSEGLYLTLPLNWPESVDFKKNMITLFSTLAPLDLLLKSSSFEK